GRRHTRFSRDWSSDVCSSDLHLGPVNLDLTTRRGGPLRRLKDVGKNPHVVPVVSLENGVVIDVPRGDRSVEGVMVGRITKHLPLDRKSGVWGESGRPGRRGGS